MHNAVTISNFLEVDELKNVHPRVMIRENLKANRAPAMYCGSVKLRSTFTVGLLKTSSGVVSMTQVQTL